MDLCPRILFQLDLDDGEALVVFVNTTVQHAITLGELPDFLVGLSSKGLKPLLNRLHSGK